MTISFNLAYIPDDQEFLSKTNSTQGVSGFLKSATLVVTYNSGLGHSQSGISAMCTLTMPSIRV